MDVELRDSHTPLLALHYARWVARKRPLLRHNNRVGESLMARTAKELPMLCVIDEHAFRRESIVQCLRRFCWPGNIVATPSVEGFLAGPGRNSHPGQLVILSLGSLTAKSVPVQRWINCLHSSDPNLQVVILSNLNEPSDLPIAALEAGVSGFIPTSLEPAVVRRALELIAAGGRFYPPILLPEPSQPRPAHLTYVVPKAHSHTLTACQSKVLEHLRLGRSNKLIARELKLSEATVKAHVHKIIRKLGVRNRTQAALYAPLLPNIREADGNRLPETALAPRLQLAG
jgi:DNA-binding NarL/FixJ family response regulator